MTIPPEILYGVGMIIILACLAWGVFRNRQQTTHEKAVTEEATREEYKRPETYARKEQELKREVLPD